MKRTRWWILVALVVGAGLGVRSPEVGAHDHVRDHLAWPGMHPVYDQNEKPVPVTWQDRTFIVRPVRVDLDEVAPGRHEQRAVRLHVRNLKEPGEHTIAWERAVFENEGAMAGFKRRLEALMSAKLISVRVRVIEDRDAPAWNRRWRAVELPYWAEVPVY